MANSELVRKLALAMPNVEERPSYGMPAFFVRRKLFARLLEDNDCVVVKIDKRDREQRMAADPDAFFITDHYLKYPMMIIRLSTMDVDDLGDLLNDAWKHAGGVTSSFTNDPRQSQRSLISWHPAERYSPSHDHLRHLDGVVYGNVSPF